MRYAIIFAAAFLASCAASDVSRYSPSVSAEAQARPSYGTDLDACRASVAAQQDEGEAVAEAVIPIYGMVKLFDTSDPSTYYGRRRAVDECMKAKGYGS